MTLTNWAPKNLRGFTHRLTLTTGALLSAACGLRTEWRGSEHQTQAVEHVRAILVGSSGSYASVVPQAFWKHHLLASMTCTSVFCDQKRVAIGPDFHFDVLNRFDTGGDPTRAFNGTTLSERVVISDSNVEEYMRFALNNLPGHFSWKGYIAERSVAEAFRECKIDCSKIHLPKKLAWHATDDGCWELTFWVWERVTEVVTERRLVVRPDGTVDYHRFMVVEMGDVEFFLPSGEYAWGVNWCSDAAGPVEARCSPPGQTYWTVGSEMGF